MSEQTIFRRAKDAENPYVMIDKDIFQDSSISWKAKGMMGYLLSRPNNWTVRMGDLAKRSPDGMTSVRAGLKELEMAGYLTRQRSQDEQGHFQWVIEVHEVPVEPSIENPHVENPSMENPHVENQTLLSTDLPSTECTKEETPSGVSPETDPDTDPAMVFPDDLPKKEPTKKRFRKQRDYLDLAAETLAVTGGAPSWTQPAAAGGADPWADGPLTAVCELMRFTPDALSDTDRKAWPRVLEKIATKEGVGPATFIEACQLWPKHGPAWKGTKGAPYNNVHQNGFQDDIVGLIRQLKSGTVTPTDKWSRAL